MGLCPLSCVFSDQANSFLAQCPEDHPQSMGDGVGNSQGQPSAHCCQLDMKNEPCIEISMGRSGDQAERLTLELNRKVFEILICIM